MTRLVPRMQRYRNNLTALSQLYNLYLVAYQGQIFIYVPRSIPRQTLPRHPDLRLVPRPSDVAGRIGGFQDPSDPHQINHIMVGALGTQEAVMACFDDGDVVAYLTSDIAKCIANRPSAVACAAPPLQSGIRSVPRNASPRPFLHENVGKSAWGLALHKKSRLIAVSSNRREVTVFALGLAPSRNRGQEPETCEYCHGDCEHVESHVRQRDHNWRIVVTLGGLANNIPNLCFIDDDEGSAELICAVDIKGAIWLANIWKPFGAATRIERCDCPQLRRSSSPWPVTSSGWGILALPREHFLTVNSTLELFGAPGRDVVPLCNWTWDIESHLRDIPDNPCIERLVAPRWNDEPYLGAMAAEAAQALIAASVQHVDADASQHSDSDVVSADDAAIEEELDDGVETESDDVGALDEILPDLTGVSSSGTGEETQPLAVDQLIAQGNSASSGLEGPATAAKTGQGWLDMAYYPHEGLALPMPQETTELVKFLKAETRSNRNQAKDASTMEKLANRYHVLRLYETELELRNLDLGSKSAGRELNVLCPQALSMGWDQMLPATRLLFRGTNRLSMVAHVPELSLVVAASAVGRVLLVTPTRLTRPVKQGQGQLQHGFRVDWVLPRWSDEMAHRQTLRPLHGMAVGPVQEQGAGQGGPRRFRLMLHYRNHDILTYELTREEEMGKLCIF